MELKHDILKLLIENKDNDFSIREIALKLKVNYKNTHSAVQKIKESISTVKKGQAVLISFNASFTLDNFIVETERKKALSKKLSLLLQDISNSENPFFIPVLFGSYAKGTQSKHSDIDLCVIHDNVELCKSLKRKLSIHPNLEIHDFAYTEFVQMIKNSDFNVGNEIVKYGIPLKNIESYYEVMKLGRKTNT